MFDPNLGLDEILLIDEYAIQARADHRSSSRTPAWWIDLIAFVLAAIILAALVLMVASSVGGPET